MSSPTLPSSPPPTNEDHHHQDGNNDNNIINLLPNQVPSSSPTSEAAAAESSTASRNDETAGGRESSTNNTTSLLPPALRLMGGSYNTSPQLNNKNNNISFESSNNSSAALSSSQNHLPRSPTLQGRGPQQAQLTGVKRGWGKRSNNNNNNANLFDLSTSGGREGGLLLNTSSPLTADGGVFVTNHSNRNSSATLLDVSPSHQNVNNNNNSGGVAEFLSGESNNKGSGSGHHYSRNSLVLGGGASSTNNSMITMYTNNNVINNNSKHQHRTSTPSMANNSSTTNKDHLSVSVNSSVSRNNGADADDYGYLNKDPAVAAAMKNLEPGTFVFPPLTWDAIKPFVPSKKIDWATASLESSTITGFTEDAVRSEYLKFLYRDIIAFLATLPISGGFLYAAFLIKWYTDYFRILIFVGTSLAVIFALLDSCFHFLIPIPTDTQIQLRRIFVIICQIASISLCSVTVYTSQTNCHQQFDFIKEWGFEPERASLPVVNTPRYFLDCVLTINPYTFVMLGASITHMRLQFLPSLLLLCLELGLTGLSLAWQNTPQLSAREYGVFVTVFMTGFIFAVGQVFVKEKLQQDQFRNSCSLEKSHRIAHQAAEHVDKLLCSMLPASVLSRVLLNEPIEDSALMATVFCSDMVSFTSWSSSRSVQEVVDLLNQLCISSDKLCHQLRIEKVTTLGDAYICQSGLPDPVPDHAARIVKFAILYQQNVERIANSRQDWQKIRFRVGVHSGALTGTCFGTSQLRYEVFGETRLIAENIEKNGSPGKVLISPVTAELLSENLALKCTPFFRPHSVNNDPSAGAEEKQAVVDLAPFLSAATINRLYNSDPLMPLFVATFANNNENGEGVQEDDGQSSNNTRRSKNNNIINSDNESDNEKEMRKNFIKQRTEAKKKAERLARKKKLIAEEKKKSKNMMKRRKSFAVSPNLLKQHGEDDNNNKNNNADGGEEDEEENNNNEDKPLLFNSISEIEAYYSERKYNWIFLAFANCEDEYLDFARNEMSSMVLWNRFFLLVVVFAIMICVPIQGLTFPHATSISLLSISLLFSLISTLVTAYGKYYCSPGAENENKVLWSYLDGAGAILLLVTIPLVTVGASYVDNAMVGRDTAWLSMMLGPLVANGLTNLETAYKIPFFFIAVPLTIMLIQWERVMMSANLLFLILASMLVFLLIILYEKLLRRQFVEQIVAKEYSKKTLAAAEDQKTLLESMVPVHVIPDLVQWMKSDMATDESIAKEQMIVVAFVKLVPSKQHELAKISNEHISGSNNTVIAERLSTTPTASENRISASEIDENVLPPLYQQLQQQNPYQQHLDAMEDHAAWLSVAHVEVDRILNEQAAQQMQRYGVNNNNNNNNMMSDTASSMMSFASSSSPHTPKQDNDHQSPSSSLSNQHHSEYTVGGASKNIIVKIKVNEDQIIFAGPFLPGGQSPTTEQLHIASMEMLRLCEKLNEESTTTTSSLFTAKCGIHVGSAMAAVLGVERLAFDLFGDSLNTASRILYSTLGNIATLHEPSVCVSEQFVEVLNHYDHEEQQEEDEGNNNNTSNRKGGGITISNLENNFFTLDEPHTIHAKGKGELVVRNVRMSSSFS